MSEPLFQFDWPWALLLLLLVPVYAWLRGRRGATASVRFPATGLARQVSRFVKARPGRLTLTLRLLVLTLAILALARPQIGEGTRHIQASGIDIVLALDLSGSMWAHDLELADQRVDRLTVVKDVVERFIARRPNDRIGLVAFAAQPYLVSPLTLNHTWLQQNLDRLRIGLIEDGTAIGNALATSVNRLRDVESKSRIVILLTDGENNRGDITPIAAAEAAAAFDIKVYTIGVGEEGLVPFPRLGRDGEPLTDQRGRMILTRIESSLDEEILQRIAETTDARFFRARDTAQLQEIYAAIDALEKTDVEMQFRAVWRDLFPWLVFAALGLLALEQLLTQTRYQRLP